MEAKCQSLKAHEFSALEFRMEPWSALGKGRMLTADRDLNITVAEEKGLEALNKGEREEPLKSNV